MLVIRQKMIYRTDIQANPDILYVFGDNLSRQGMGGQAAEMRGEPNSFGVATKRSINHNFPDDFFFDNEPDTSRIIKEEMDNLSAKLSEEIVPVYSFDDPSNLRWKAVVIPSDGLGTGLARLPELAPKALAYIERRIKLLKEI